MAFPAELLEVGINIANSLTPGVQSICVLEQFIGSGPSGDFEYDDPINVNAVVDYTNKVSIREGQIVTVSATITVLERIEPNLAVTDPPRKNPIDPRDKLTLPDGSTGSIISVPGAVNNPKTGTGFIQVIEIGSRG